MLLFGFGLFLVFSVVLVVCACNIGNSHYTVTQTDDSDDDNDDSDDEMDQFDDDADEQRGNIVSEGFSHFHMNACGGGKTATPPLR